MGPDRCQWHEGTDGFISWTLVTTFEVVGMFDEIGESLVCYLEICVRL